MSIYDRLLEQISDPDARVKFSSAVASAPEISRWIVDPATVQKAQEVDQWSRENWDDEHGMTRAEYAYSQRVAALEEEAEQGRNRMTLEELGQELERFTTSKGLMTTAQFNTALQQKEAEFGNSLNTMARIATKVPYLNQKHEKEFGETFDPEAFLSKATEAGAANLDDFYDTFTKDKRAAKQEAEVERRIAEAKDLGKREAMQAQSMSEHGQMPTMDGAPEIGHFQKTLMANRADTGNGIPAGAELGRGTIARAAAVAGDQAAFMGRVN